MSPVRRRPMLVLTDLLTSWKTSEKLKLRSRLSDTSMWFRAGCCWRMASRILLAWTRLFTWSDLQGLVLGIGSVRLLELQRTFLSDQVLWELLSLVSR